MPGAAIPGRNDPCPCGSGRKFKQCCLEARTIEDAARLKIRGAEGRVVPAILEFAARTFGQPFFEHAWDDFFLGENVPEDMAATPEFDTMFIPWFVLSFVGDPEADEAAPDWPDRPMGLHWLETMDPDVSETDRAFIEAACRSPMSAFVVEAAAPGRSLDLTDVLTGRGFHVLEVSASQTLRPGDLHFTRVVTVGGTSVMFGGTPYIVPPRWHVPIIDWRDGWFGKRRPTRQMLVDVDIEVRDLYHRVIDDVLHPRMPTLRNTDGDDIEWTTLTYDLSLPVKDAFTLLKPLATVGDEEFLDDVEMDASGAVTSAKLTWTKAGNKKHKAWTNTSLGHIDLSPGRLKADVNSKKRADRLARELARRLGLGATLVSRTVTDMQTALAARQEQRVAGTLAQPDLESEAERDPALLELENDLFRSHLDEWIRMRIPALGHRTPAQAARTAGGRERLDALLCDFERTTERQPGATVKLQAIGALRKRLGVRRP